MTTTTTDLASWLLARIADDEAAARAAIGATGDAVWDAQSFRVVASGEFKVADASVPSAAHIARHDPARVLAQCAAFREVVAIAEAQIRLGREARGWDNWEDMANQTLRALTLPFADHEDYDPRWGVS